MATDDLEEKIHKIRLQNEEIRRRYEEVEADKKYAAKQNALVQMVPSDDWPERKEPPEFSVPKNVQKQKPMNKEHNDRLPQHYSSIQDRLGKKDHKFNQGDGPPPDPKYNFLADSEREMRAGDDGRTDEEKNRPRNKAPRGGPRRRGGGGNSGGGSRDAFFKDNRGPQAFHSKEESLPEYEAWRAERNRIDEARINRQKTAEGNWRREWDSNKTNIEKDSSRKGESNRKDSNMYERRNNHYDSDYSNRGHGGSRTYHGSQKTHGHQDYRRPHHDQSHEYKRQQDNKTPLSPSDDRTVTASDKSIKVTVNPTNQPKGPVMSVKVNSPSIAGTGRVGPRQKSRITYSSQSDVEGTNQEFNNFSRQKSFDEKTAGAIFNNGPKSTPKSPFTQRKKEGNSKSPYPQKKEFRNDESSIRSKNITKPMYSQKIESKDQRQTNNPASKPQRNQKRNYKLSGDKLENIVLANDDALPAEYQPDKSPNNAKDLKVNDNDNITDISNLVIDQNQGSLDESKDLDSSAMIEKSTNEIVSNYPLEDANCKNKENDDKIEEKGDCKEPISSESNINGNDQICKTEIGDSQNDNSNLEEEKENKPEIELESVNDKIQNIDLSSNTEQTIILQDITVEQDSIPVSNNIQQTISQDTVFEQDSIQLSSNTQQTILQDITVEPGLIPVSSNLQQTISQDIVLEQDSIQLNSNTQQTILQDIAVEQNSIQLSNNIQEAILQDIVIQQDSIKQSENTQQAVPQNITVEQDSLQLSNNTQTILQDATVEKNSAVEEATLTEVAYNDQEVEQKIPKEKIDTLASETSIEEITLTNGQENTNSEQVVHNDDQNIESQLNEDFKLQEEDKVKVNENKLIDQEKNILEKSENTDIEPTIVEKELIKINESKSDELITISQNESINDSGLKDISNVNESIELDDTDITQTISSQNISTNDSGIMDDSIEIQTVTPVNPSIALDNKNNVEKVISEPIKSIIVESTKEICEKTAESCDISATSSETSKTVKDDTEANGNDQEVKETLENRTKDNGVDIMENVNKIESSKQTDLQKEILPEKENPEIEESTKVATE